MRDLRSCLAVIPARGGSKGIPRKNMKGFLGKPLIAWTIEMARESGAFDRLILSTEDDEIAQIGKAYGAMVPFHRPQALAEDATPTAPVVRHAVEWLIDHEDWTPEFVMVLEPTSPGRRAFHILEALTLLRTRDADSLASVCEVPHHYVPQKLVQLHADGTLTGIEGTHLGHMIHRRQDLPKHFALNGLIFACRTELVLLNPPTLWGENVQAYVVDPKYSVDLDGPEDWAPAEAKLRHILVDEK